MTIKEAVEYMDNSGFVGDGSSGNEAWAVIKKALSESAKPSVNNRYATALEAIGDFIESGKGWNCQISTFEGFCKSRLNAKGHSA